MKKHLKQFIPQVIIVSLVLGLIGFGARYLENIPNPGKYGFSDALEGGILFLLLVPFIFLMIYLGISSYEYFAPYFRVKKLQAPKYRFLLDQGFMVKEKAYLEGTYKGYHFRVYTMKETIQNKKGRFKQVSFDLIESCYTFPNRIINEGNLSSRYYFGTLFFENHVVGLIPTPSSKLDFEEALNGLVLVLKREELMPLSFEEWQEKYNIKEEENDPVKE